MEPLLVIDYWLRLALSCISLAYSFTLSIIEFYFHSQLLGSFECFFLVQIVRMSEQWRAYNQSIRDNLEDEEEEEYMMNQVVYMNQLESSDNELVQRGGSRPSRQPNNDRLALFHAELLYNDYFSETPVFDAASFCEVYRMRKCFFCVCMMLCVQLTTTLNRKQIVLVLLGCHHCKRLQLPCVCSRLVHLPKRKKNIVGWRLALLENPCCVSVEGFVGVLNKSTYVNPLIMTL